MRWALSLLFLVALGAALTGAKLNVTHHKHALVQLYHKRIGIGDPALWLASMNCALSGSQIDVLAHELQNLLNGCFLTTSVVGDRTTSALRIKCLFPPPTEAERVAFGLETLLPAVKALLHVTNDACTEGPKFGITLEQRVSVKAPEAYKAASLPVQTQAPAGWALDRVDQRTGLNQNYRYMRQGTGVTIYNIDTCIRPTHVQFGGRATAWADFADGGGSWANSHGTSTMSVAGGATVGIARNATLNGCCALDPTGNGYLSDVIFCLVAIAEEMAEAARAAVLFMSLTGPADDLMDAYVMDLVTTHKMGVVAAAGNDYGLSVSLFSPARIAGILTVGASTQTDGFASFSNVGALDLVAPGQNVAAATSASDTAMTTGATGTSYSTPLTAGYLAVIMEEMLPTIDGAAAMATLKSRASASGSIRISGYPLLYTGTGLPPAPPPPPPPPGLPAVPPQSSGGAAPHIPPPPTKSKVWWGNEPQQPHVQLVTAGGTGSDRPVAWPPTVWVLLAGLIAVALFVG